jgi:hypothetical protein
LKRLLRPFAAAADKYAGLSLLGGSFHGGGIQAIQGHELGAGEVNFPVLGRRADVDEGQALAGLEVFVELFGLNLHVFAWI